MAAFGLVDEQRVHMQAVFVVEEAGRGLDLLHVVGFGQVLAKQVLQLLTFLVGRVDQIDPTGRVRGAGGQLGHVPFAEHSFFDVVNVQHAKLLANKMGRRQVSTRLR